ncbi:hypothetical protein [Mumia zhuanghuii]|uniref:hypothetical protein n=1 Tax=Mumia zhuanghuii TaxID=2585211 RepID=UPI003626C5BA
MRLRGAHDADATASAVAAFLPTAIASLHGVEPDGGSWIAEFQYAPAGFGVQPAEETAAAAIVRALALTGVSADDVSMVPFTAGELREPYESAGSSDVSDWSVPDLMIGLIVDLTNANLSEVVESATDRALSGDALAEHRQQTLRAVLHGWAATYEGPEDG